MHWPKGKYGDRFGGWGNTQEEAWANQRKAEEQAGTAGLYPPLTIEWMEAVERAFPRPKKRRPRPEGAPLTKTELKRQATKERIRARLIASNEKYGNKLEEQIAAAGQPLR
jgi:hypothetical protein